MTMTFFMDFTIAYVAQDFRHATSIHKQLEEAASPKVSA